MYACVMINWTSTKQAKIYFVLTRSINMNLSPSLNDGCHLTASFDMLLAMVLMNFYFQYRYVTH